MALTWKSGGGADLPDGGTKGQALVKKSNANQDVEWGDAAGNTESMELTQAEYDALTDEEKNNGTIYFITDGQGGGGGGETPNLEAVLTKGNTTSKDIAIQGSVGGTTVKTRLGLQSYWVYSAEEGYTSGTGGLFEETNIGAAGGFIGAAYRKNGVITDEREFRIGYSGNAATAEVTASVRMDDKMKQAFRTALGITDEPILESPNGTKYKLKVADDGSLSTEVVA